MIGLLGTLILFVLIYLGYTGTSFGVVAIGAIANTLIGVSYPAGRTASLKERGLYWRVLIHSIPIQFVFAAILYGLGYGVAALMPDGF